MKILVTVYKDGETKPFNSIRLSLDDDIYHTEVVDDFDEFIEEQFAEIAEFEDE